MDPVRLLVAAERAIFSFVGLLFFVAAFVVAIRALGDLWSVATAPSDELLASGTAFLDVMLLVLMIVELAYTIIVSVRGSELQAEPFLLVGLIACIRRILVITIGGVGPRGAAPETETFGVGQSVELGVLTAVVLVLVLAIAVLRRGVASNGAELNARATHHPPDVPLR
jgi:hypothetical protein